jgi:hypothetical protein
MQDTKITSPPQTRRGAGLPSHPDFTNMLAIVG